MKTFQTELRSFCAFLFLAQQVLGQSCYTPDGQQGHCVPLNECSKVFDIFSRSPKGSETYLRQFLCKELNQLKVCCSTTANFTFLENDPTLDPFSRDNCVQHYVTDFDLALILRVSGDSNVEGKRCLGIPANPRYIITPARCVVSNTQRQQFTVVGVNFRDKNNNFPTFGVEEVISHPFFDPVTGTNDIALLRLNQTVPDDNDPPLCMLPWSEYSLKIGESLLTYSNLALSTIERGLNKTTVSITSLSKEECEQDFQQKGAHVVLTKYHLCTKDVKNVTKFTCNEFIGVPLMEDSRGGANVGFSSSGTVCNDGLPDIYINLRAYIGWLEGQMKPWPKSDRCTTPNGEIGECWDLPYCPALWDAFSSVTNSTEAYLRGFFCEAREEFSACCVTSSNSTIVLKKDESKLVDLPIKFLETGLCGLQHRDDYFSSSSAIAIDEFPWIALIEMDRGGLLPCTGTLINSRYVLSTYNCLYDALRLDMDTIIVRLGDYNYYNETSCVKDPDIDATDCTETEKYGIEKIILHPFFSWSFPLHDIGLLRLNKTVTYYTDFIRPICLPMPGTLTPKVGDTMYMSSWGLQNYKSKLGIKRKVLTQLIHEEECQRRFPALYHVQHFNRICTLDYQNNTEFATPLDQSGQLMFHNNYRWHIAGLVVYTAYEDFLTISVNISKYMIWIIESMEPW